MWQRKIDRQGRLYIPIEILKKQNILAGQEMEIIIEYGEICLKKFSRIDLKTRPHVGLVKKIDESNRLVIPIEFLGVLGIKRGAYVTLRLEEDVIKIL